VELADGSLYSWARTDVGEQFSFRSRDDGDTWTPPEATELKSPCSPASIKRLPHSAVLLAIYNDHSGRFPFTVGKNAYGGRTPLVAAFSHDNGRTWPQRKLLEGDLEGAFAYIAIHFVGDSVLLGYSAGKARGAHLGSLRIRKVSLSWLEAP
jgi:sialidase-1